MKTGKIYFAKVKPNAKIPTKKDEDAGYDIYACFDEDYMQINPHETKMIPTGLASACSKDYYFQLFERGSTGTKGIGQRCGVIDSGFRDAWFIPITNHNIFIMMIIKDENNINTARHLEYLRSEGNYVIIYPYSKAISQAVVLPVPKLNIKEVTYDELLQFESERGIRSLGSTNK